MIQGGVKEAQKPRGRGPGGGPGGRVEGNIFDKVSDAIFWAQILSARPHRSKTIIHRRTYFVEPIQTWIQGSLRLRHVKGLLKGLQKTF